MAGDVDVHQSCDMSQLLDGVYCKTGMDKAKGPPIGRPLLRRLSEIYLAFMRESISSILALRSALTCCKLVRSPMNFM
jgi:hypothetical protein